MEIAKNEEKFKIDSFKLRIPISKIDVTTLPPNIKQECKTFTVNPLTNKVDYEIDTNGEFQLLNEIPSKTKIFNSVMISNDAGTTKMEYHLEQSYISHKRLAECISFKITAKHLKEQYFNGINKTNIGLIFDYINTAVDDAGNTIKISKDAFMNGYITDIDTCKDVIFLDANFDDLIKYIDIRSKNYKERGKGYNRFNTKDNKGIEFGERETATLNYPYLKFYSKTLDAKSNKHNKFFNEYNIEIKEGIFRMEFTLKNKKHLQKYNINNTLKDILEVTNEEWSIICKSITDYHFNKSETIKEIENCLKYGDAVMDLLELLLIFKPSDISINQLEGIIEKQMNKRMAKRTIEKLKIIHNRKMVDDKNYKISNEISNYFEVIL